MYEDCSAEKKLKITFGNKVTWEWLIGENSQTVKQVSVNYVQVMCLVNELLLLQFSISFKFLVLSPSCSLWQCFLSCIFHRANSIIWTVVANENIIPGVKITESPITEWLAWVQESPVSFNNRIFCLSAAGEFGVSDSIGSGIYDYTLIAAGWMPGITDRLLRFNNSFLAVVPRLPQT